MRRSDGAIWFAKRCTVGAMSVILALGGMPAVPALAEEATAEQQAEEQIEAEVEPEEAEELQAEPQEDVALELEAKRVDVTADDTEWSDGTYVVSGSITNNNRITCKGEVTLVLNEGATLTAEGHHGLHGQQAHD